MADKHLDNGEQLRTLIEKAGVTQSAALEMFNKGQALQLSLGQWKAYLAKPESSRRSPCPDAVLTRMKKLFKVE